MISKRRVKMSHSLAAIIGSRSQCPLYLGQQAIPQKDTHVLLNEQSFSMVSAELDLSTAPAMWLPQL